MVRHYLPEGRLLATAENRARCAGLTVLRTARARETVLEGRATLCTPAHDLTVAVGPLTGIVPREEAALGIREGRTREIAILSRVGKPIAFTVTDIRPDGTLLLSRRRAQELALGWLLGQPPGTVLPATVTHLEGFGAFVDVGCGVPSLIGIEHCSVARIAHPSCRFVPGQEIWAVLTGADPAAGRVELSHKELLGTWAENAARFAPGMTVPGYVRGILPYGTFVELAPNLTGLADRTEGLAEGDRVSVHIKAIVPERMKVKLTILHRLDPLPGPPPLDYRITAGRIDRWRYAPPECVRPPIETVFSP